MSTPNPLPIAFRSALREAIYSTKVALSSTIQAHGRANGYAIRI